MKRIYWALRRATCRPCGIGLGTVGLALWLGSSPASRAADSLLWRTNDNQVTADIRSTTLPKVLQKVAASTGWEVFLEPGITRTVSAKFSNLAPGEALRLLLGDLNFALLPDQGNKPRLFVFRTTMQHATELVRAEKPGQSKLIPNELIVRLKPGAKIDELARQLGAKVLGRMTNSNAYLLEFQDAATANTAREQLGANPDVAAIDNNYFIERPPQPGDVAATSVPPVQLKLNPPPSNGRVIVGLVDTAVQPLGGGLDSFLLKPISVAGPSQLDPTEPSHGTSMAETILRSVQDITKGASSVQILPVDVYGPNPETTTFDVANGIAQAVNNGATIVNLSLGSDSDSPFLHSVIQDASAQKIVMIGAAGNTPVTSPTFPAAYSEVMAVTAVDQGQIAPYANRGSFVSLGAPGTSVVYYDNQPYYVVGTSAAAAFTTGMAAGYMDSTHNGADKTQAFIRENFGLKPATGP